LAMALIAGSVSAFDIGTHLTRTYGLFIEQPLNAGNATSDGYSMFNSSCDPIVGFKYSSVGNPSQGSQSMVAYTAAGQLSGWGIRVWPAEGSSYFSTQLISRGYWRDSGADDGSYDLWFATRDPAIVCSGDSAPEVIGDRLNIWDVQSIPLNMSSAQANGWVEGNCIPLMGIHHAYDLNAPGTNTWNWMSLVPVQPMYDSLAEGNPLNAVLVNIPQLQLTEPLGQCEGPFGNDKFCLNWCENTGCTWSGPSDWVTMHFHIVPILSISCSGAKCNIL